MINNFCSFIVLVFVKSKEVKTINSGNFLGADWYYTTYYTHLCECFKHQTWTADSELMRMNCNILT